MSTDPKVAELLAPMRDRAADTGSRRFKVDREKILSRMVEVSMSEGEAPSRRVRTYAALALAAGFALIAAGAGYKAMHGTTAVATVTAPHLDIVALEGEVARVQGSAKGIAPGHTTAVAPDGAIETSAHAQARIKTENGVEIELRENTRVSLNDMNGAEPRVSLHLDSGAIRCVVPHLADGHSLVVTPDARVVDRGTIFTVSVIGIGAAARTVVRVEEGMVVVQHASGETQLTATQAWGRQRARNRAAHGGRADCRVDQKCGAGPRSGRRAAHDRHSEAAERNPRRRDEPLAAWARQRAQRRLAGSRGFVRIAAVALSRIAPRPRCPSRALAGQRQLGEASGERSASRRQRDWMGLRCKRRMRE